MLISVGLFFSKKISFLFFTDVGVRDINVRVQEILLISYSNSILLTEGDRGVRKSFILQELCHVNRNEKGFLIFFQVFGVNEITPFYYRK